MKSNTNLIIAIIVIAVAVLAFVAYDRRSPTEKAGDSIREAGRDIKDAVEPRSPAEKIGDSVKDTVRDIKN
jgi:hypothetical protein